MFERHAVGEQAILVHVEFTQDEDSESLSELEMLVSSAGVAALSVVTATRHVPNAKYFVGLGKADEIASVVNTLCANIVIFNHSLSPSQERNLEQLFGCRVLDRTGLILDIFAQRARSHEGKLQVELAQLRHLSTRLVRGWTHLERQKGGIGLRGPGETQLETDRRLIRGRIKSILKRLEKVQSQREQGRRSRQRNEVPTISLVGYTNAGKSTLFNAVTGDQVYAADQLFATLDATLRKIKIPDVGWSILADTVGFIRHLPHDLVAAFKATLQETKEADLQLHIVDASDQCYLQNIEQVHDVLRQIDADHVPKLMIYNKLDKLDAVMPRIERDAQGIAQAVWLSAQSGDGLDLLQIALSERLSVAMMVCQLCIPVDRGQLRGLLYRSNWVINEFYAQDGSCCVDIRLPLRDWHRLIKQQGTEIEKFIVSHHKTK